MLRRESNKKKETRVDYNPRLFFYLRRLRVDRTNLKFAAPDAPRDGTTA